MTPYYSENGVTIYHGDCLQAMPSMQDSVIDTIITDPPYGLSFMGKEWDRGIPGVPFWQAALRVAKPGAILLAFGGTRTFHRLACAVEDAGWEIRDCMMWLYGSGFPKSLDISKAIDKSAGAEREILASGKPVKRMIPGADQNSTGSWIKDDGRVYIPQQPLPSTESARTWNGWGTALKPAWEPIIVAMKPLEGTYAENAISHGVAGLNIDGGRIETNEKITNHSRGEESAKSKGKYGDSVQQQTHQTTGQKLGRWPANVLLDEGSAAILDGQTGNITSGKPTGIKTGGRLNCYGTFAGGIPVTGFGDSGGASRFFYSAKASKCERGEGNTHPTVKPLSLMKYLCKLTATPTGGIVLDMFAGSGSTLVAAREFGRPCIGIELDKSSCDIMVDRLSQGVLSCIGGAA